MKKTPNEIANMDKLKPIITELNARYNWKKQRTEFEGFKFGTNRYTNSSTCSGQWNTRDDSNSDSVSD